MHKRITTFAGKSLRTLLRVRGSSGSALPGLLIEKIDPSFVSSTLNSLPRGVVLISGSNGKTTTTKMVVELLESQNLRVFTNRSGSNFVRGVASSLLGAVDSSGNLQADIAVLELDEAHAVRFIELIQPRYSLFLNVMRDQLDRFGEIDHTAALLGKVAQSTTERVVVNREDPRLVRIAAHLPPERVRYFGLSDALIPLFPSDDDMRNESSFTTNSKLQADVVLESLEGNSAQFNIHDTIHRANLKLHGVYNVYNAAAALTLVRSIMGDALQNQTLYSTLENITPAFGRGETILVNGKSIELILVKNPAGFRLSLQSFDASGHHTMIAINDNYADGRDMSWLWDVEFESLREQGVHTVTGVRAYDMALRLQYDDVTFKHVETDIRQATRIFVDGPSDLPRRIYCTYTAMLAIRKELGKHTTVEAIQT